jgi:hypothetical protein
LGISRCHKVGRTGALELSQRALVLGLLIATAESSYTTQSGEFTQMSANFILLDRVLAHYGPESKEARDLLQRSVARQLDQIRPENGTAPAKFDPAAAGGEVVYDKIQPRSSPRWLFTSPTWCPRRGFHGAS